MLLEFRLWCAKKRMRDAGSEYSLQNDACSFSLLPAIVAVEVKSSMQIQKTEDQPGQLFTLLHDLRSPFVARVGH